MHSKSYVRLKQNRKLSNGNLQLSLQEQSHPVSNKIRKQHANPAKINYQVVFLKDNL